MNRPGFRQRKAKPAKPDPRRNLHVERGRAVVVNDITPYARPKCGKCKKGIAREVKNDAGEVIGAEPCVCATTRFYKAHPEVIVTEAGEAFWPAEDAPLPPLAHQLVDAQGQPIVQRETREPEPGETDPG